MFITFGAVGLSCAASWDVKHVLALKGASMDHSSFSNFRMLATIHTLLASFSCLSNIGAINQLTKLAVLRVSAELLESKILNIQLKKFEAV